MISFEREGNKFRIKLSGDRQKMYAGSFKEMEQALAHYYSEDCGQQAYPSPAGPPCPLCAASVIAEKRLARKGGSR